MNNESLEEISAGIDFIATEQYFEEDAVGATAHAVCVPQAATGLVHWEAPYQSNAVQPNG